METVRCGHMSHVTFRKIGTQSVVNDQRYLEGFFILPTALQQMQLPTMDTVELRIVGIAII